MVRLSIPIFVHVACIIVHFLLLFKGYLGPEVFSYTYPRLVSIVSHFLCIYAVI